MRSTEKFMREAYVDGASALQRLRERPFSDAATVDIEAVDTAIKVFADAINILADHDKQAKARRERIQWVYCDERTMVARYKGRTFRYSGVYRRVDVDTKAGWVEIGKVTSIEGASRKVRAWRKKQ